MARNWCWRRESRASIVVSKRVSGYITCTLPVWFHFGHRAKPLKLPWNNNSNELRQATTSRPILDAAARVTCDKGNFDRGLTQLLHEKLHWLDVRDCVTFKLVVMVNWCLNGWAPQYIPRRSLCPTYCSAKDLRSAERNLPHVTCHRLDTYGTAARLLSLLVRPPGAFF